MKLLRVNLRVTDTQFADIAAALALRSISLQNYIRQLVEADCAPIRLEKWRSTLPAPSEAVKPPQFDNTRLKLSPVQIQRVLFLHDAGMPAATIAQRFQCSATTIARILCRRDTHRIHTRIASGATGHGRTWCKNLSPRKELQQ